jgi:hypothetical protein
MNEFERDYLRVFPNVLTQHPERFARTSDGADYLDGVTSTAWALWKIARPPIGPIETRLNQLIIDARAAGLVFTVDLEPLQPFAMGRYCMAPSWRNARHSLPVPPPDDVAEFLGRHTGRLDGDFDPCQLKAASAAPPAAATSFDDEIDAEFEKIARIERRYFAQWHRKHRRIDRETAWLVWQAACCLRP